MTYIIPKPPNLTLATPITHSLTPTTIMKKLYKKNSTVHPSTTHLHLVLPAAIFTLTLTLTPQDKETLSYLISTTTTTTFTTTTHHSPLFTCTCTCFSCYTTYWVRWDTSPNRHLIHQIIDAFEDSLVIKNKTKKHSTRNNKTKKQLLLPLPNVNNININESHEDLHTSVIVAESTTELTRSTELSQVNEFDDGPVVWKLMSLIGERIWSVWT
ncbi:uncharacterized protein LOC143564090 [Bidens hawaiensis]|uniref:uncharacterized protein LOC143564090 n=1 Tax=Bidens hawaiensis TaxID=980011 RepID=UPI004049CB33